MFDYVSNLNVENHILNIGQIFRTTIAVSGSEKEVNLYGGPDLPYLRQKHAEQHALDKLLSTIAETL